MAPHLFRDFVINRQRRLDDYLAVGNTAGHAGGLRLAVVWLLLRLRVVIRFLLVVHRVAHARTSRAHRRRGVVHAGHRHHVLHTHALVFVHRHVVLVHRLHVRFHVGLLLFVLVFLVFVLVVRLGRR